MIKIINKKIFLTRGDTALIKLTLKRVVNGEATVFVPAANQSIVMNISASKQSTPLIRKVLTSADFVEDVCQIKFKPSETEDYDFGTYCYNMQLITDNSAISEEEDRETFIAPNKFILCEVLPDGGDNDG